jgi:hypothetical protein
MLTMRDSGEDVYEKFAIRCNLKVLFIVIIFNGRQCTNDTQIDQSWNFKKVYVG